MSEVVFLSLGSNLGDRTLFLEKALSALNRNGVRVCVVSSLYETDPVDRTDQPTFVNLACQAMTDLSPGDLLAHCKEIERALGRQTRIAKGPREIDIDILLFGDRTIEQPGLTIPHPGLSRRRFVLVPLAEIAPDLVDPSSGRDIQALLRDCPDQSGVWRIESPAGLR